MMKTNFKNKIKQLYLFVFLCVTVVSAHAQSEGYLTNRIKPGDILYQDGNGEEHFVDYRLTMALSLVVLNVASLAGMAGSWRRVRGMPANGRR